MGSWAGGGPDVYTASWMDVYSEESSGVPHLSGPAENKHCAVNKNYKIHKRQSAHFIHFVGHGEHHLACENHSMKAVEGTKPK